MSTTKQTTHPDQGRSRKRNCFPSHGVTVKGLYRRGQVFWFQPPMKGGARPKPFSLETEDPGQAIAAVLRWQAHPTNHLPGGSWSEEIKNYLDERKALDRMARHTASARSYVLTRFARFAIARGAHKPAEVRSPICEAWYLEYLKKGNASTARDRLAYVKRFFAWLITEQRGPRSNPALDIKTKAVISAVRKGFVPRESVRRLLARARLASLHAAHTYGRNSREWLSARDLETYLYLGFDAGLRKNEMIEARPSWFTRIPGAISIEETPTFRPKDRDARTVPLTARFSRFLHRAYGFPSTPLPDPWVIRPEKPPGRNLYRVEPKKAISTFFRDSRTPCTIHDMRRSFVSNRLIAGVDIFRVSEWIGDRVDVVQKHYGHLLPLDATINRGV